MGTIPWARRRGFNSAKNQLGFGFKLASTRPLLPPRSGHDRGPESPLIVASSSRNDSAAKDVRLRLHRAAIAARSDCDRGALPRIVCTVR